MLTELWMEGWDSPHERDRHKWDENISVQATGFRQSLEFKHTHILPENN